jgi:hypothetical protein
MNRCGNLFYLGVSGPISLDSAWTLKAEIKHHISAFCYSQTASGLVHTSRLVTLNEQIENLRRRQALEAVNRDGHIADAGRLADVGFLAPDTEGQRYVAQIKLVSTAEAFVYVQTALRVK